MNQDILINDVKAKIASNLSIHIRELLPKHPIQEAYSYSLLPTGKLFRPMLAVSLAKDLFKEFSYEKNLSSSSPLSYFCSFLETHHAYTLAHDDLPCMDNDDFRRGKPSLHKAYNEWKALLIGDGLINFSYHLLAKTNHSSTKHILEIATRLLGPNGLILGQMLDLALDEKKPPTFLEILNIHMLKTSRLLQISLLGPYHLRRENNSSQFQEEKYKMGHDLYKLGTYLGLLFQLLDDQSEMKSSLSLHEQKINAFYLYPKLAQESLHKYLEKTFSLLKKHQLSNLEIYINDWYKRTS